MRFAVSRFTNKDQWLGLPNVTTFSKLMVSNDDYQHFLAAESKGRHFLSHIRNCFPYERLAKLHVA